jgi:hypothetical protein
MQIAKYTATHINLDTIFQRTKNQHNQYKKKRTWVLVQLVRFSVLSLPASQTLQLVAPSAF